MKTIRADQIRAVALGGAVYGTGGGGDPYLGRVTAEQAMRKSGDVHLVDVDSLADDALVVPVAVIGAPAVLLEKLPEATQLVEALRALEQYLGQRAAALLCAEAGGLNSTIPFCVASQLGLPVVDGDLMGRAFPEIQMTLCTLQGVQASPLSLADEKGNTLVVRATSNAYAERFVRSVTTDMGGSACGALYPMTGRQAKACTVRGSMSQLVRTGEALLEARIANADPVEAVRKVTKGRLLHRGKVVDVKRETKGGFTRGQITITGLDPDAESPDLTVNFQNEFLVAAFGSTIAATTPDLIIVLDLETGEPVTGELIRFGLRVAVLAVPCVDEWKTPDAINLVGPRYFGYDIDFVPVVHQE